MCSFIQGWSFFICIVHYPSQLPSMVKTLHTSHNTGHIWTHHHWNAHHCTAVQLPVNHLCYRNLLAHIICARRSSIEVWDVLSSYGNYFCALCIASLGGSHSSHKGSAVHEKAPMQRSHEPSPAAFVSSSRKSIPIPGLHARVQRESRTKVSFSCISTMFKIFTIVIRHFWYATSQKKEKRCACVLWRMCVKIYSHKFVFTESDATTVKVSRQDSASSSVPPTPSPVEKTAPPTITRPDYAAGLGPDTTSTPYGDQQPTSSAVSQPTPITPITPSMMNSYYFLYLMHSL